KNLFVDLVERISEELKLENCWICGETQISEYWPWDGLSLKPSDILKIKQLDKTEGEHMLVRRDETWRLGNKLIREECIKRVGKKFKIDKGKLPCKRYLIVKDSHKKWIPHTPALYWSLEGRGTEC
ncbi:ENR1 protein, partial [Chloropsis hardwickii]|nr:ENR1 protein [Chloropsis hardwickii]